MLDSSPRLISQLTAPAPGHGHRHLAGPTRLACLRTCAARPLRLRLHPLRGPSARHHRFPAHPRGHDPKPPPAAHRSNDTSISNDTRIGRNDTIRHRNRRGLLDRALSSIQLYQQRVSCLLIPRHRASEGPWVATTEDRKHALGYAGTKGAPVTPTPPTLERYQALRNGPAWDSKDAAAGQLPAFAGLIKPAQTLMTGSDAGSAPQWCRDEGGCSGRA